MKKLRILVKVGLIKEYYLTLPFHLDGDESALTQSDEDRTESKRVRRRWRRRNILFAFIIKRNVQYVIAMKK